MVEPLLLNGRFTAKVSSVLNRDSRQFGKKYMFDGLDETCWNSDEGSPQCVLIEFPDPVLVSQIIVRFQGGFAGKECSLQGLEEAAEDGTELLKFYPKDISSLQTFPLSPSLSFRKYKLIFENSTDFFGRITIYSLQMTGKIEHS